MACIYKCTLRICLSAIQNTFTLFLSSVVVVVVVVAAAAAAAVVAVDYAVSK